MYQLILTYSIKFIYSIVFIYGIILTFYGGLYLLPFTLIFILPSILALYFDFKIESKKELDFNRIIILKIVILILYLLSFYVLDIDLFDLIFNKADIRS